MAQNHYQIIAVKSEFPTCNTARRKLRCPVMTVMWLDCGIIETEIRASIRLQFTDCQRAAMTIQLNIPDSRQTTYLRSDSTVSIWTWLKNNGSWMCCYKHLDLSRETIKPHFHFLNNSFICGTFVNETL